MNLCYSLILRVFRTTVGNCHCLVLIAVMSYRLYMSEIRYISVKNYITGQVLSMQLNYPSATIQMLAANDLISLAPSQSSSSIPSISYRH